MSVSCEDGLKISAVPHFYNPYLGVFKWNETLFLNNTSFSLFLVFDMLFLISDFRGR